ncbi:uncharacterized protein LOC121568149 [Coregonus clupeaformis]|uniref:uncharacterized protein LOC121568149 n=1 Tax=Coregonus clupeaformis TaxID=59861 RepID=UPI001E1C44D9|nr:uncharacterized protein LOC121568149 [Coregonus clupeaformis]
MERTGGGVESSGADSSLVVWSLLISCLFSGADSSLVVWSLLISCLLSGPATGDQHAHCSEFLCLSPPSPLVRLLSFSSEQGPCGSPLDLPPPPGLPGLAPGPVAWSPLCPTVVIVPGRRPARLQPSWARVMAGELLEAGLVNVLVADWLLPPEQEITEGARQVGERLAQAIQTLQVGTQATQTLQVGTQAIQTLQVGTQAIQTLQVGTQAIQTLQVGTQAIQTLQVGTQAIQTLQVGTQAIQTLQVGTQAIQTLQVGAQAIQTLQVGTQAIQTLQVGAQAIQTLQVGTCSTLGRRRTRALLQSCSTW